MPRKKSTDKRTETVEKTVFVHNDAPRRRALCVGINDYPFEGNDLNGCVNDAKAWQKLLNENFGFDDQDIKLLLDSQATKQNIMDELENLVKGALPGDILVFTNSSHGSYIADKDGDETYDEILCPYDISNTTYIVDDDLRNTFGKLPDGVKLTVILDNCHAGTGLRAAIDELVPGLFNPDERRVRFLNPKLFDRDILLNPYRAKPKTRTKYPESKMREILLGGCRDNESSYDALFGDTYHGAMTYYAINAIKAANNQITYAQLHKRVRNLIREYPQTPQLEGNEMNKKRQIFS